MGDHRGETGGEDDCRAEAEARERQMKEATAMIAVAVAERGLARTLAEIVANPFSFGIPRR